ncbi:MAG: restriction endonuclease subunit S [Candidatus Pseudomonas colombiensis]|nr:MAG: restriction endonuclease subunit S [Pseudomonas sp.]
MTFASYPANKDSGIEWLGHVPEHWNITPLKFSASCNDTVLPDSTDDDYEIEYVEISDVNETSGITRSTSFKFSEAPSRARRILQDGDVLISTVRTYLRAIAPVVAPPANLIASTGFAVVRPRKGVLDGNFLGYLLRAEWWISEVIARSVGVSYPAINASDLISLSIPVPAWHEQTQIARFLDHETARIDALIEEQQRLIELLKEKRQAVISHAVTKGLDPTAPLKDSGVEWLGEVPAHWVVRKLKNLVSVRGGSTPSKEVEHYWTGDIPWVSPKDMKSERINDSIDHISESAIEDGGLNMVKSGAILIVVRGMILIHSVPVAITDVDVTINQDMKAMTPGTELSSDYLSLMLQGIRDAVFQYIDSSAHGTRKLEWERFELIELPIPPHAEQLKVISFIEKQKRAIDDLAEQAASAITMIKERRSSLISAAVTGKIDVRGWQPPTTARSPELAQEAV